MNWNILKWTLTIDKRTVQREGEKNVNGGGRLVGATCFTQAWLAFIKDAFFL